MILFDPALLEHVEEQRAHNAKLMETTAAMKDLDTTSEQGLAWLRDAMEPGGLFGMQAFDFPTTREIPGPDGPIPIRVMVPEQVDGVYLHFHGCGFSLGSAAGMDPRNWAVARKACSVAVVSVDYRLAGASVSRRARRRRSRRTLAHRAASAEFGTDRLLVGGESAGAYLSILHDDPVA